MSIKYSDFIDPQNIKAVIGSDYQNEAKIVTSGLITREPLPTSGTHTTWLREKLFSGDDEGQTAGVDTEISLKNKEQTEYQVSLVDRADGAEFDDISEEIMTKAAKEGAETELTNAISAKSAQMLDSVGIKIIDGCGAFIITNETNYNNANGSQVNLVDLEQTKSKRGEKGVNFEGGFMVMRGLMYHQIAALGLVAQTSNTLGNIKQSEIVAGGVVGTVLGMNIITTDKIALEAGGDHYIHFLERGALRMMMSGAPDIDPFIRKERSFQDSIKFRIKAGGIVEGLSWTGAKSNPAAVTNTALATGTNYELAKAFIKNVPMCVARFDAPSF